jgi:hypothetical protein
MSDLEEYQAKKIEELIIENNRLKDSFVIAQKAILDIKPSINEKTEWLLDNFARTAMQAFINELSFVKAENNQLIPNFSLIAKFSYEQARAMLEEKNAN